jgi:hypothetical protein
MRGALRKFPTAGVCKMKNESLSLSERIQAFSRELALSLRRITGRAVETDLLPVVQPVQEQKQAADARDE